eukprot:584781-Amphidinium_carterae.1
MAAALVSVAHALNLPVQVWNAMQVAEATVLFGRNEVPKFVASTHVSNHTQPLSNSVLLAELVKA